MFQTPVIEVPTNLPNIRNDLPVQAFAVGYSFPQVCLISIPSLKVFSFNLT